MRDVDEMVEKGIEQHYQLEKLRLQARLREGREQRLSDRREQHRALKTNTGS